MNLACFVEWKIVKRFLHTIVEILWRKDWTIRTYMQGWERPFTNSTRLKRFSNKRFWDCWKKNANTYSGYWLGIKSLVMKYLLLADKKWMKLFSCQSDCCVWVTLEDKEILSFLPCALMSCLYFARTWACWKP